ncbi:TetR family transcriptional regulator [Streptomyces sp. A7024]|uniref:TetR family transcriptional regulator n=1 Tax=Streptomyces coryli TaxID=1128680 RepID=A0A6G4U470_9ACTN|nr:TetR/AcrR family transcriptional regulator C-terminal domain-containing protein [Streptomyces coryli]NGN66540.1 TetR family transcriptional regulator [Streptomyces coryli]
MARDTLTRDQIVRTAVELLDDDGLEGLNMRALGKRLGAAPTAVYWHVKTKDELVLLAGDRVWDEIELADPGAPDDWRTAATQLAAGLHALFARHPWLVQAFGSYLFYGPGKARFDDRCLAVYESAGFTAPQADRAAAAVFTYVLGSALAGAADVSLARRLNRQGDAEEQIRRTMAKAREVAAEFPRLRARLDTPADDYNAAPEQTFEHGLQALLDGLAAAPGGR